MEERGPANTYVLPRCLSSFFLCVSCTIAELLSLTPFSLLFSFPPSFSLPPTPSTFFLHFHHCPLYSLSAPVIHSLSSSFPYRLPILRPILHTLSLSNPLSLPPSLRLLTSHLSSLTLFFAIFLSTSYSLSLSRHQSLLYFSLLPSLSLSVSLTHSTHPKILLFLLSFQPPSPATFPFFLHTPKIPHSPPPPSPSLPRVYIDAAKSIMCKITFFLL